ncbi:hypothetical protein P691DRAFT_787811 [Macrolepiota fuliginosa MF-IS2]|uniref:Uncharacterized protein n=1 Tax=Macrolepiota fuliginosa MF-IS2 TaxID=1400762 RepID=A0A9P6BZQ4_9AGAR|nr:hypothetical protein P691DRAFT_787811 [Macrolepiota fuliginosa MF-IS2]
MPTPPRSCPFLPVPHSALSRAGPQLCAEERDQALCTTMNYKGGAYVLVWAWAIGTFNEAVHAIHALQIGNQPRRNGTPPDPTISRHKKAVGDGVKTEGFPSKVVNNSEWRYNMRDPSNEGELSRTTYCLYQTKAYCPPDHKTREVVWRRTAPGENDGYMN